MELVDLRYIMCQHQRQESLVFLKYRLVTFERLCRSVFIITLTFYPANTMKLHNPKTNLDLLYSF